MVRGMLGLVLVCAVMLGSVSVAEAVTFTSPNFSINGALGNSVAGQPGSTNYKMEASGGESIIGSGASGSYKLGQGYVATLERSLQVNVQPNGLVAHWPMEIATAGGPMYDESSNNNTGTFSAGAGLTTGKVGNAYSSSVSDYSEVPHNASFLSGAAMTLSGWVYHDNIVQEALMAKWNYDPNNGSWAWQTTSAGDRLRMFIKASGTDPGNNYVDTTGTTIAINTWYHVTAVYDGTQPNSSRVKMYINGVLQPTTTTGTIPTTLTSSSHPVRVGDFSGLSRYWRGSLDEMKIYNKVLTASEVKAEYDAGNVGIPAGLSLNSITPGTSQVAAFDSIVQTDSPGYTLAINQNNNLTSGSNTIAGVSGSIASPVSWVEGTTKGLGFTLFGTNATAIPVKWGSGNNYAAMPNTSTAFYTRTGYTGGTKDVLNMRFRLDTTTSQPNGDYTNQMMIIGTMTP